MDMRSEPSVIVGTITAFVTAAIGLLVAFGLDITDEQKNAVLAMTAVLAPIIAGVIIRSKVYAPETVREIAAGQHPAFDPMDESTWPSTPIGGTTPPKRDQSRGAGTV